MLGRVLERVAAKSGSPQSTGSPGTWKSILKKSKKREENQHHIIHFLVFLISILITIGRL